jgi:hypothetical protein
MRRSLIAVACVLCATPALALDMPARRAGLWELKMSFDNGGMPGQTMRQCIDVETDRLMQSNFGGSPRQTCTKQEVAREGKTVVVDSVCRFAGVTTTSHAVITGSFDSAYTMKVTTWRDGAPPAPGLSVDGANHLTIAATWLGPCAAGQRAGDMMMPNGRTVNVRDMRSLRAMRRPQ